MKSIDLFNQTSHSESSVSRADKKRPLAKTVHWQVSIEKRVDQSRQGDFLTGNTFTHYRSGARKCQKPHTVSPFLLL